MPGARGNRALSARGYSDDEIAVAMRQNVAVVAQVLNVLLRVVTFELQVKERQEALEARLEELEAALGHNIRYEA